MVNTWSYSVISIVGLDMSEYLKTIKQVSIHMHRGIKKHKRKYLISEHQKNQRLKIVCETTRGLNTK